ncbi:MAG: DUF1499 domain-containing protein [Pirellulales bacterium]|nr:DUF1499 domain-containing protein [Pirellulales bacterium]
MWTFLLIVLVIVVAVAAILATQIDDWSRDLSQNTARTDSAAADPGLHPLRVRASVDDAAVAVAAAAATLPRWAVADRTVSATAGARLAFVRTTPLMRFKDDIVITISPLPEGGVIVDAESKSRVGKGDLGQNPRNIKELFAAIKVQLGERAVQP